MNRLKLVFEQTMMVSFMVLCYIGLFGLFFLRGTGFGYLFYWYRGTFGFILTSVIYAVIYAGSWIITLLIFKRDEKLSSGALDKIETKNEI